MLALLIAMSAYFSATEMAFSSANRIRIKNLAEGGNKRAALVMKMSRDFDKLLSTILVGNNIVNILSTSLATVLFVAFFGNLGVTLSTVVMTVVVLVFGEVCPKGIAKESPEKFAMFSAPVLRAFIIVFTPLTVFLIGCKKLIVKIARTDGEKKAAISEDEIISFVEEAENEGGIDEQESELIRSAVEFGGTTAGDIATPRVDIIAIERGLSKAAIADTFIKSGMSRLPVYEDNLDNIVGIIHHKDFFNTVYDKPCKVESILKKPLFVTQFMKTPDLLKLLQRTKAHMAVVADEYGGVYGIVTMEDILEELVGEIWDEHDQVTEDITKVAEDAYRVNGSVGFDKLIEFFDIDEEDEFTSVSGWVMDKLEKIPVKGDSFECGNLTVTVSSTDQRRVKEVIIRKKPE